MFQTLYIIDNSLDYSEDIKPQIDQYQGVKYHDIRITVMDLTGQVRGDNYVLLEEDMENHIKRKEVEEALNGGEGWAKRDSYTLEQPMIYVAIISSNGDYILRMSQSFYGVKNYLILLLPVILISILIAIVISSFLAKRFSASISRPLREISTELFKTNNKVLDFEFKKYKYDEINIIAESTEKMAKEIKKSIDQIEFEKKIRQEFFTNASHELKTPITSIRGYVELLENDMVENKELKERFLGRIKFEVDNMVNLINDILMIARLETKDIEITFSKISMPLLLNEVVESLTPFALKNGVTIETNSKPVSVVANPQQIKDLLNNLLINGIKYNKVGGKVIISITQENRYLVIIVEDTGIGIAEDKKARVFERFYRIDKGRSKKIGGTGLGLSIAKHIVNYYNGSIILESAFGKGSKFFVYLPLFKE